MALLESIRHIGILDAGRLRAWKPQFRSPGSSRRLPIVVRLSIIGFHFRKLFKALRVQVQEAA